MKCGNSSVGRAQPCQGWGREFESLFPLHKYSSPCGGLAEWLCSGLQSRGRRFDSDSRLHKNDGVVTHANLYIAAMAEQVDARDLKSLGLYARAGSIPARGTILFFYMYSSMINFSYTSLVKSSNRPSRNLVDKIIRRTLQYKFSTISLSIIVVDNVTSQEYNLQYRNKNMPTNVISLEYYEQREQFNLLIGELILAEEVILTEALAQNKNVINHYVHMLVHGLLHLQGYDHQIDADAEEMEALEVIIMKSLGYSNPYL